MVKRLMDVVLSALGIALLLPLLAVIAMAVKFGSPGPILFKQERVGLHGRRFTILKFRTMTHEAVRGGRDVSPAGDPRVTRVGAVLRRWYLDELPQLVNVLRGQMSLVGPRPETPEYVALYTPEERKVLSVPPGLVGPSTLAFMNESELLSGASDPHALYVQRILHDRVRLDMEYVDRRSIAYDTGILFRQAASILFRR